MSLAGTLSFSFEGWSTSKKIRIRNWKQIQRVQMEKGVCKRTGARYTLLSGFRAHHLFPLVCPWTFQLRCYGFYTGLHSSRQFDTDQLIQTWKKIPWNQIWSVVLEPNASHPKKRMSCLNAVAGEHRGERRQTDRPTEIGSVCETVASRKPSYLANKPVHSNRCYVSGSLAWAPGPYVAKQ